MKQIFASALLAIIFLSCNNGGGNKVKQKPLADQADEVVITKGDSVTGIWLPIIAVRNISTIFDSTGNFHFDSAYYTQSSEEKLMYDSAGLPIKDSLGNYKKKQVPKYDRIDPKYVNTEISNIPLRILRQGKPTMKNKPQ